MSLNKNAFIRYKALDECFRNTRRNFFIRDLINACNERLREFNFSERGISRRQVYEDIRFMESEAGWKVQLKKERINKEVAYSYFDPNFSISQMPISSIEAEQLRLVADILVQFQGVAHFEWVSELIPKFKEGALSNQTKLVAFDYNPYLKGLNYLPQLYDAIQSCRVLHIDYHPFQQEKSTKFILHPYYLKEYNNRWFLFGNNPDVPKGDWNLAIDRIVAIEHINETFIKNSLIDWDEYFEDIIGVSKPLGAKVEKIKLHFFGRTGHYVVSKPLHGSQKAKWIDSQTLEVHLELILNHELEQLLLSFGEDVVVISPLQLTNNLEHRLRKAMENYDKSPL